MDSVKDYLEFVKAPWGRMFYDLLFTQLNIPDSPRLKILDFGSGLCVTADHYAALHDVTAVEPNEEMIDSRIKENAYTQLHGGLETLAAFEDDTFDFIFCHNVLEYVEDKEPVVAELLRVLKHGGTLSVVKHNRAGRVFHSAVFWNDPKTALSLLEEGAGSDGGCLGAQRLYANEELQAWAKRHKGEIARVFGLRAFFALGQDNKVKYTDAWFRDMLTLEQAVMEKPVYREAAFFNHLMITKVQEETR